MLGMRISLCRAWVGGGRCTLTGPTTTHANPRPTQAALVEGVESLSQAKVGSALQVIFNLEELQQVREQRRRRRRQQLLLLLLLLPHGKQRLRKDCRGCAAGPLAGARAFGRCLGWCQGSGASQRVGLDQAPLMMSA